MRPRTLVALPLALVAVLALSAAALAGGWAAATMAEPPRGQVAFIYAARGGLPPSVLLDGAGLLITQNQGSMDAGLARKVIDTGGKVDRVRVGASPAYWITGSAHSFWYLAPNGDVIVESGRRVGNTLAWQRDDVLYRIEGAIDLERALQIAESMP